MKSKSLKATFSLHDATLKALDAAVRGGAAPSKNAFVEEALRLHLREIERQRRRARWQQAARDPLMRKDLDEVERDFAHADAETARRIG